MDNGNMTFIITQPPEFCPGCGVKIRGWDGIGRQDFYSHASFQCLGCGARYQYAESDAIYKTAEEVGGDL